MREKIAAQLIRRQYAHPSERFRRMEIRILTRLTARAFGVPVPRGAAKDADPLEAYAAFTRSCMERGTADEERLYRMAYRLGRRIRRVSGLKRTKDVQRLVFLLYRNIGIDMSGRLPEEIRVPRCYFSGSYSPEHCRIMSAVDSGVVAGIWGGGCLEFSQRLTEGCPYCIAHLKEER